MDVPQTTTPRHLLYVGEPWLLNALETCVRSELERTEIDLLETPHDLTLTKHLYYTKATLTQLNLERANHGYQAA